MIPTRPHGLEVWRARGFSAPLRARFSADGAALDLVVESADDGPPLVVVQLSRDDVRDLVEALDGFLYDSRPQ